jgi:hypothetical protein
MPRRQQGLHNSHLDRLLGWRRLSWRLSNDGHTTIEGCQGLTN